MDLFPLQIYPPNLSLQKNSREAFYYMCRKKT